MWASCQTSKSWGHMIAGEGNWPLELWIQGIRPVSRFIVTLTGCLATGCKWKTTCIKKNTEETLYLQFNSLKLWNPQWYRKSRIFTWLNGNSAVGSFLFEFFVPFSSKPAFGVSLHYHHPAYNFTQIQVQLFNMIVFQENLKQNSNITLSDRSVEQINSQR